MRLTEYSQEVASVICERIAEGESIRSISKDPAMPAMSTIFKWLTQQPSFAEQYARARDEQAETLADEITYIADTEEDVQRARVRIDARKWVAGKLKPKKYGEKMQLDAVVTNRPAEELPDDELARIAAGSGGRAAQEA